MFSRMNLNPKTTAYIPWNELYKASYGIEAPFNIEDKLIELGYIYYNYHSNHKNSYSIYCIPSHILEFLKDIDSYIDNPIPINVKKVVEKIKEDDIDRIIFLYVYMNWLHSWSYLNEITEKNYLTDTKPGSYAGNGHSLYFSPLYKAEFKKIITDEVNHVVENEVKILKSVVEYAFKDKAIIQKIAPYYNPKWDGWATVITDGIEVMSVLVVPALMWSSYHPSPHVSFIRSQKCPLIIMSRPITGTLLKPIYEKDSYFEDNMIILSTYDNTYFIKGQGPKMFDVFLKYADDLGLEFNDITKRIKILMKNAGLSTLTKREGYLNIPSEIPIQETPPTKINSEKKGMIPSIHSLNSQPKLSLPGTETKTPAPPLQSGDKKKEIVASLSDRFKDNAILLGAEKSPQYGVIGNASGKKLLIDLNETHTISVFGLQGSGKSYTLGVITEMAVEEIQNISMLPNPLSTVIFHYSKKESYVPEFISLIRPNTNQKDIRELREIYEAESAAIQSLKVLVPPAKLEARKKEYKGLQVEPLLFRPKELGASEWKLLLGAGKEQLYLKKIKNILEKLKEENRLTIDELKSEIVKSELDKRQKELSVLRLGFVEKFLNENAKPFAEYLLSGSVVLLDIRDEMLDEHEASLLLDILLITMGRTEGNKLLVIDEAHKYFGRTLERDILELIREMRHTATRILIASQDPPSVNAKVIELSDIIILHQMSSPEWLKHIQGKNIALKRLNPEDLSSLRSGEAYVWAKRSTAKALTERPIKIKIRIRLTQHGGATKIAVPF